MSCQVQALSHIFIITTAWTSPHAIHMLNCDVIAGHSTDNIADNVNGDREREVPNVLGVNNMSSADGPKSDAKKSLLSRRKSVAVVSISARHAFSSPYLIDQS